MDSFDFESLVPAGLGSTEANNYALRIWAIAGLYVPSIYILQWVMKSREKFQLRWLMVAWNSILSILSFAGWWVMTRGLGWGLLKAEYWEQDFPAPVRLVTILFCLTKSIEYGDTIFLVLAKKPLLPLHVWHHLTVALYCWHAQWVSIGFGHLFCYINLFIHGIMYGYYACAIVFRGSKIIRKIRIVITLLQLMQMVIGLGITVWAGRALDLEPAHAVNCTAATLMYLSYLYLFGLFYIQNYMGPTKNPRSNALAFTAIVFTTYVAATAVIDRVETQTLFTALAIIVALICAYGAPRTSAFPESPSANKNSTPSIKNKQPDQEELSQPLAT